MQWNHVVGCGCGVVHRNSRRALVWNSAWESRREPPSVAAGYNREKSIASMRNLRFRVVGESGLHDVGLHLAHAGQLRQAGAESKNRCHVEHCPRRNQYQYRTPVGKNWQKSVSFPWTESMKSRGALPCDVVVRKIAWALVASSRQLWQEWSRSRGVNVRPAGRSDA